MKCIFIFFFCFLFFASSLFALADGETDVSTEVVPDPPTTISELNNSDYYEVTDISVYSVSPVSSSSTSGLKSVLLDFLGDYDGIIVEYEYQNPNASYKQYLREVQPDYVWIASFLLLALFIYCLFRLGGALIG